MDRVTAEALGLPKKRRKKRCDRKYPSTAAKQAAYRQRLKAKLVAGPLCAEEWDFLCAELLDHGSWLDRCGELERSDRICDVFNKLTSFFNVKERLLKSDAV